MYINKALIYGNLTRDPEMRSLPSGVQVTNFSLATNRVYKDKDGQKQENTDYHNVVVFGRQAETVKQYLHKGDSAYVEGRMQTRSWDGPDGQKKYRTEVIAERVQFGPKRGGDSSNYSDNNSQQNDNSNAGNQDQGNENDGGDTIDYPEEDISPEDIPF